MPHLQLQEGDFRRNSPYFPLLVFFTSSPCSPDVLKLYSPNKNVIVNQCMISSRQVCYEPAGILVQEALSWIVSLIYIIYVARICRRLISKVKNILPCWHYHTELSKCPIISYWKVNKDCNIVVSIV